MVNDIFLIVCIPITLFIGCYFTLQGYKLGIANNTKIKFEENEEEIEISRVNEEKQKEVQEIINEYLGM